MVLLIIVIKINHRVEELKFNESGKNKKIYSPMNHNYIRQFHLFKNNSPYHVL